MFRYNLRNKQQDVYLMDYLISYVACNFIRIGNSKGFLVNHIIPRGFFSLKSFQMEIFNYVQIRKSLKMHPKDVQQVRTKKERKTKKMVVLYL